MKQRVITDKPKQFTNKPEIISLRQLKKEERPYDMDEREKNQPHDVGEQSAAGSMPNPEVVTSKTTLDRAKRMGVYQKEE